MNSDYSAPCTNTVNMLIVVDILLRRKAVILDDVSLGLQISFYGLKKQYFKISLTFATKISSKFKVSHYKLMIKIVCLKIRKKIYNTEKQISTCIISIVYLNICIYYFMNLRNYIIWYHENCVIFVFCYIFRLITELSFVFTINAIFYLCMINQL